jgi:hypothetical protein
MASWLHIGLSVSRIYESSGDKGVEWLADGLIDFVACFVRSTE